MAQTYKFGSGTWATKKGSTLAYNNENNNFKPLPFSFTRNSIATRVNKQGLIEVVGNDIPRIDYTDSTEGVLLLENSSTNLVKYSEDVFNSYWGKYSGATVEATKVISPSGKLDAYQITYDGTTNGRIEKAITVTSGAAYTFSFYARVSSGTQDFIYGHYQNQNGTLTTEWQRFVITENENDTTSYPRIICNDVATIEVYGIQLEQSAFSTSYIPTSGSTVQRAAETCNGSGNSEVFNSQEGILFAEVASLSNPPSSETAISISEGTSGANRLLIRQKTNGTIGLVLRVANSTQASFDTDTVNTLLNSKLAAKYKVNDIALWINGFEVGTDTSASVFASDTINQMNFNQGNNSNHFYGKTKELGYYDTALTDEELETLTSYRSLSELVTELNLNTL